MKIAIIGRTKWLLDAAHLLVAQGHSLAFVYTCRAEAFYGVSEADFEALAREQGVPFFNDLKIHDRVDELRNLGADIAVSVNWLGLLRRDILDAFPHGVLNAHAGDLPRYRGNACPNWAILNFEPEVCLTIHKMVEELDAGPWLMKERMALTEETTVTEIYAWLDTVIPQAFAGAIEGLASGHLAFQAQDPNIRPLRAFPRRPEDSRIDWRASTRDILALIRASAPPFEGAFTHLEGQEKLRIFKARAYKPDYDFLAIPGQVCLGHQGNPVIATQDGMIEIVSCAMDGLSEEGAKKRILSSLRHRLG